MITVTLGTIPFPFDRAINWLSVLLEVGIISENVFVQHGITDVSSLAKYSLVTTTPIVETSTLMKQIENSNLVISHAGQGLTKILASQGACFILLPRLSRYKEHIDDHQLFFAKEVEKLGIPYCLSLENLQEAILHPPPPFQRRLFEEPKLVNHLLKVYPV
ncbi:glycosyl transferase [Aetokthonos hydrillicola Thurmond2011]|jgi:UDP-N-acetylglucosamine transferase subunit ALG13|uniref:Glycosyl transferase n=1 Tax=Aetokthonos hydrillicola Thurmond2011 TaxID=2712845 RepID=A0AAP5M7P0_9CYAN|nr:glycosyltransferase [Aetokthonos hydrillicola]MBO3458285.1 glycosyl transferase [Aetokthonos hydrillicola CCALA 1050]MBW4585847.1 glycosyl transferase [Aetokthonos hydrillicola CCALA 1050]MDR9893927.1 glycosyl transferase [Aetokthonos hydrillicola Thurmond2011]